MLEESDRVQRSEGDIAGGGIFSLFYKQRFV